MWDAFLKANPLPDGTKRVAVKDNTTDQYHRELSATLTELAEVGAWGDMVTVLEATPTSPPTAASLVRGDQPPPACARGTSFAIVRSAKRPRTVPSL